MLHKHTIPSHIKPPFSKQHNSRYISILVVLPLQLSVTSLGLSSRLQTETLELLTISDAKSLNRCKIFYSLPLDIRKQDTVRSKYDHDVFHGAQILYVSWLTRSFEILIPLKRNVEES